MAGSSHSQLLTKRFPSVEDGRSINLSIITHPENEIHEIWLGESGKIVVSEGGDSESDKFGNAKKIITKGSSKEYKEKGKRVSYDESLTHDRDNLNNTEGDKTEVELDKESEIVEEEVEEEIEVEEEEEDVVTEKYDEGEEEEMEKLLNDYENVPDDAEAPVKVDDETDELERQLNRNKQLKKREGDDKEGQLVGQEKHVIVIELADIAEKLPASEARKESTDTKPMTKKKIIKIKKLVKRKKVSKEEAPVAERKPSHFNGKNNELKNERTSQQMINEKVLLQEEMELERQKIIAEHEKLHETVKSKLNELMKARKKNKMLHKSMIDYYKKKKMEYVYEGESPTTELVRRYIKKIKLLDEMMIATELERQKRTEEVNELKLKLQEYEDDYKKELAAFLSWEMEVGKSVIESDTGKGTDENLVELIVQRHEVVLNQLSSARLRLIKLQKQLSFKDNTLKSLVCLEGNLTLLDYEHLRMENSNFSEKIEERDEELSNLRKKMLSVIHTYAHVREKASSIIEEIDKNQMHIQIVDVKVNAARERVNKLTQSRDGLRGETMKLKKSAGLVLQPKLIIYYEDSKEKFIEIRTKLESSENDFNQRRSKILRLRDLIQTITTLHDTTVFN